MQTGKRPGGLPDRRTLWTVVAVLGGLAFALCAVLNAPGVAYIVVALCLGAAYTVVASLARRDRRL